MNKLTHEQFDKMWEDSTKEEVLFQFYYDYYKKVEALDKIDKAIEYIENNQLYEDLTEYDDEINFSYVDDLKATKELLSILRGEDNA